MARFSLLIVGILGLSGCSAAVTDYTPCTDNASCRDAFGFGWECMEDGFCDTMEPHERCLETFPSDLYERPEVYKDAVVFGSLMNHTDSKPYVEAAELALFLVSDDRTAGSFAVIHCKTDDDLSLDGRTGDARITSPALWLADTVGIPGLIGPDFSSTTVTAYDVLEPYNVFMMSPSATSEELTTIDGAEKSDDNPGLFWRTAPPDTLQARVIAQDMILRKRSRVGVIFTNGSYGSGLAASFKLNFEGDVIERPFLSDSERDEAIYDLGADPEIEEVLFISPEVVDYAALINAAQILEGYARKGLFLTDGAAQQSLLDSTTDSTEVYPLIRGTRPARPSGTLWGYFTTSYFNHYGRNPLNDAYSAYAHDAGWLTLYAAAGSTFKEGNVTGPGMAAAMRRMSDGESVTLNRSAWPRGLELLAEGASIDVEGSSGALDYDPVTEETFAPIEVWNIQGGADDPWSLGTIRVVTE